MKPQFINISLNDTKTIRMKNVEQSYLNTPFHFHHLCELVWIEESNGKRIIGDNIDNFSDGDLVLMEPHLPHIWQNDSVFFDGVEALKVKSTVIYFPPYFLLNLTDEPDIIQPEVETILSEIGDWLKTNGTAAYGSRITENYNSRNLWFTQSKDGKTIYAFYVPTENESIPAVIEWEDNIPQLKSKIIFLKPGKSVKWKRTEKGVQVEIPNAKKLKSEPLVFAFER